jgi:hypothetical protein
MCAAVGGAAVGGGGSTSGFVQNVIDRLDVGGYFVGTQLDARVLM